MDDVSQLTSDLKLSQLQSRGSVVVLSSVLDEVFRSQMIETRFIATKRKSYVSRERMYHHGGSVTPLVVGRCAMDRTSWARLGPAHCPHGTSRSHDDIHREN